MAFGRADSTKIMINGNPTVGQILTVDSEEERTNLNYRWFRSDDSQIQRRDVIDGANNDNYKLTLEDEGKYISLLIWRQGTNSTSDEEWYYRQVGPVKGNGG